MRAMTRPFEFRDENGNLILDQALGAEHVAHYTRILASASPEFAEAQRRLETLGLRDWRDPPAAAWRTERVEDDLIRLRSHLPAVASSCRDLVPLVTHVWDVCGYYRRLRLCWRAMVGATVKALRLAALALDPRQEDERLMYALTQLLNPGVRRAYDLMQLGGLFLLDRDVNAGIRKAAAREAAARSMAGDPNVGASADDVMRDWGFDQVSDEEAVQRAQGAVTGRLLSWGSSWGYYALFRPGADWRDLPGPEEMGEWQAMVGAALDGMGIRIRFAVGAHDEDSQIVLHDSNETCIFITGKGISPEKATEAVRMGISLRQIRTDKE
jgi:hypothetical protein